MIKIEELFFLPGEFFDVREFAHLHIRLDLKKSLTLVVDVCQYIDKVSAASRDNPQQMVLASKLLGQERSCEEFLARAKDQLISMTGPELNDSFESFNVMRSAKFNHAVREKGTEEKLSAAASTSPRVVVPRPHPSINTKLAGPKVCQKQELLSERSLIELEATCGTYFVPEVHPDNPEYAPTVR